MFSKVVMLLLLVSAYVAVWQDEPTLQATNETLRGHRPPLRKSRQVWR